MCGIAGKFSFAGDVVDRALVERMCEALVHRGPDAEGIYTGPYIGLGQRRLSIIDLSDQAVPPLSNEDGTVWVVFNGEIYNFMELRHQLASSGHVFRTRTDTEILVHLYEELGEDCVHRLQGMFAFAIWDARKHQLFAARDRLGKKPFYYARNASSLLFASSVSALLASSDVSKDPNLISIDQYLRRQYVPSPNTAFRDIQKLPAAHYLLCTEEGHLDIRRYWTPPMVEQLADMSDSVAAEKVIYNGLREAVRSRMVSDVPLGALLSGGIDSGMVVAMMAMESSRPIKTFSVGFEGDPNNELPYARMVAEKYGCDHHEFMVNASIADALPLLVHHYGEPFADSSSIPTYYVTQMASQKVTVALCGDGGDESFSGYDRYGALLHWQWVDRIPKVVRKWFCRPLHKGLALLPYGRWTSRMMRGCNMVLTEFPERYRSYTSIFKDEECAAGYTTAFKAALASESRQIMAQWHEGMSATDWMMRQDQMTYLPDCLMVKADVASMANSLELRAPFLDYRLVELAARIPASLKRQGMSGKLILKKVAKDLLPTMVLNKPKTGFGIPLAEWFRKDMKGLLTDTLLSEQFAKRGLFFPPFVRKMVDEHLNGSRDWSNRLWALVFLELWYREFVD